MPPDKDSEYSELISFVSVFASYAWKIDPVDPAHPANVASHIASTMGKSKALSGARQAANDVIESLQDSTQQELAAFDAKLLEAGAVALGEMRRRYSRQYKRILKRGVIRSETEFYLVKGVLDSCTESLDQNDQVVLSSLVLAFEQSS